MNDVPAARATLQTFHIEGRHILRMNKRGGGYDVPIPDREFRAHFGASPNVCFNIWQQCENSFLHRKVRPKHLLWGFLFLNTYATESVLARTCGVTRKTFRFWSWLVVDTIRKRMPDVVGSSSLRFFLQPYLVNCLRFLTKFSCFLLYCTFTT